jgi:hypothetical protein
MEGLRMLFKTPQSLAERFYTLTHRGGGNATKELKTFYGALRAKKPYLRILLGLPTSTRLVSLLECASLSFLLDFPLVLRAPGLL